MKNLILIIIAGILVGCAPASESGGGGETPVAMNDPMPEPDNMSDPTMDGGTGDGTTTTGTGPVAGTTPYTPISAGEYAEIVTMGDEVSTHTYIIEYPSLALDGSTYTIDQNVGIYADLVTVGFTEFDREVLFTTYGYTSDVFAVAVGITVSPDTVTYSSRIEANLRS